MTTVLVVDDSLIDQQIASRCITDEGLDAIHASNGCEALAMIAREPPDLVLTDLQMPEMNGLELVRAVRQNHPLLPVMLMTAYGSEEIAMEALNCGAASYVPKKNLKRDLKTALRVVLEATESSKGRKQVIGYLRHSESYYVLGYEPGGATALVSHLQDGLTQLNLCDATNLIRVGTALTEALANAIEHGNLELDSELRESPDDAYRTLGQARTQQSPYRDRRVHVTARLTPENAVYTIRDEGPGFDPNQLPDPTDPDYITRPSGRGIMLIRTFVDKVIFNECGNEITMIINRPNRKET